MKRVLAVSEPAPLGVARCRGAWYPITLVMERRGRKTARHGARANCALGPRRARLFGVTLGLLVAVVLVVAQLASVAHLALVQHARCEHGALIHATHSTSPTDALAPQARSSGRSAATATRTESQHEHCTEVGLRPALVEIGPTCVVPELLAERAPAWSVHRRPGVRAVALLALAPKSSPPA